MEDIYMNLNIEKCIDFYSGEYKNGISLVDMGITPHIPTQNGSVKKFVSLEENDSFLVRITI